MPSDNMIVPLLGHADLAQTAIYLDLEEVASDDWMSGAPAPDLP